MFYLLLAIITSAMISMIMRLSSDKISNNISMLAISYLTGAVLASLHMSSDLTPVTADAAQRALAFVWPWEPFY